MEATITRFTSKDGTPIACRRSGTGPPLVLVHGAAGASARWRPILRALEEHFTVYAMDRRGRGESGDSDTYAIEREFEDVVAIVDSLREPANVLGHSLGGLFALEASLLTTNICKLVLYEGLEIPTTFPEGSIERMEALLETGDREGVVTALMEDIVKMPPHEIAQIKATPAWPARVAAAHTLPRELRAGQRYEFLPDRFKGMHVPTLVLTGGDSPPFFRAGAEALHAALPNSRIVVLEGQQHVADQMAPELFAHEVISFLLES